MFTLSVFSAFRPPAQVKGVGRGQEREKLRDRQTDGQTDRKKTTQKIERQRDGKSTSYRETDRSRQAAW